MTKPGQAISRAKDLANHHKMIMGYGPVNRSFPNIEEDNEVLLESYKETNKQVKAKQNIISAAEWLLDNFYMIEEQSRQIQHELPKNFRGFPVLESGMPRVYAMAEEMISYTNNQLDEDIIVGFLEDYQSVSPLDSSELWIFPFMLKIALIKKIKEIAVHTVKLQREKDVGEKWAIKLLNYVDKESNQLQELIIEHDTTNRMLSPSYIEGLLSNFRESGTKSASLMTWLDGKLGLQGTSADEMIQKSHEKQASYQIAMGNSIISLKFLSSLSWDDIFEKLSHLEKILNQDPAGFYCDMEFDSRDYYRHEIIKLAKRYKISEFLVAQTAIECAEKGMSLTNDDRREGHVGYYLIGEGRRQLKSCFGHSRGSYGILKDHPKAIYLGSIGLAVLLSMGFILYYLNNLGKTHWALLVLAGIVIIVPIITLAVGLLHWIIVKILPPYYLPKLELKGGVPEEYRTMVVVPTLLTSEKRVWELIEQMEVFYLANQEENIHFALIGDFKDSSNEEEDGDQGIIEAGEKAVNELNKRYGGDNKSIFYFFHRHRQFNSVQGSWMGVERKRGALVQFNRLLRGYDDTGFSTQVGDLSILQKIKFVITLDADTNLPRDAAKRLIGTLSHPLNRPVIDSSINRVVKGYGLLQPRIGVAVDSASKSFFSLTFSGQTGVDPYTTAVSDVYQDLFGEGIFTGKGIYEVDVFNDVLKDAIPNNSVLSHDLLEGSYIRAGLVTDIELIDGYPSNYIAYAMRLHRWVRGDWQLIRWLCSHVKNLNGETIKNPLSIISKWKIFDNMRRSLLSPTLFILLFLGFTVLPRRDWFWLGLFSITLTLPLFIDVLESFIKKIKSDNQSLRDILYETKNLAWQIILAFVFLAHQAYLMTDAIVRTLVRVFITKRNMLEWVTAADTERKFKGALEDYWRKMVPAMIMSLGFFVGITLIRGTVLLMPFVISMLWLVSPWIAYRISQPKQKEISKLSQEQIEKLKIIGRRTWRYFDKFIREEDNWLIPDNYQEEPELGIAHRTSPTNIGISIVSILGARDLGYIGTLRALDRLEKIIGSMKRLELWEGHLYNWYDTQSLEPLKPRYVSSVDSGNLACYLILAKQGIGELLSKPLVGVEMISGLEDTIVLDIEALDKSMPSMVNALKGKEEITLTQWSLAMDELDDIGEFSTRSISLFKKEIEEIVPWVKLILRTPKRFLEESGLSDKTIENYHTLIDKIDKDFTIQGIIEDYHEILDSLSEIMLSLRKTNGWKNGNKEIMMWLKDLEIALGESHMAAKRIATRCTGLMDKIGQIVHHMDFIPLYNNKKELFSIGYDVEANKLQDAYYDLLASEARQTSFIAIAKGDVPQKHWFKLARSLTLIGDYRGLLSWGGTMFEYLMPLLIMKNYDNTLWDETYHTVIKAQRQYGDQRHVPWGVSESAFYAFDLQLNYQYKAFGVPKLGLKTGLIKDIVISPYASIMGLAIDPMATVKNIEHLIAEGMAGSFGLYECIDYTPERVPRKKKSMIVKSYMAHHQGMIFLAINNYLNHNIMQERFHAIPMVKATELLLQERMPKKEIVIKDYQMDTEVFDIEQEKKSYQEVHPRRILDTAHTSTPQVCILSNSSYSTMLTQSGGGFSQYQDLAINRWREDVTKDNWGMFFYVNNLNSNNFWSSTYQPCLNSGDNYEVAFEPDKATYTRRDGNIETKTEIVVSPEDSVEIRRLSISNHSQHNRVMEVTSYFEPILAAMEDDAAHPAFVNLFVETEYIPDNDILLMTRRPRSKDQGQVWLANTMVLEGDPIGPIQYETDRSKFVGRGRDLSSPKALDPDQPLSNTTGAVLDSIMSLRNRIDIDSGNTAKLAYIVAVASTREEAINLAKNYHNPGVITRAFELAWTHSQVEMRYLNISASEVNLYQMMLSSIIYSNPYRASLFQSLDNKENRQKLWSYGISGDLPIAIIEVSKIEHLEMVRQMLSIHEYWRLKGILVDLIILNQYGNSYEQPLQERIGEMLAISHVKDLQDRSGGVFQLSGSVMPEEDKILLAWASRVFISGDLGSIASQIKDRIIDEDYPRAMEYSHKEILPHNKDDLSLVDPQELLYFNDFGGFTEDGKEYLIRLKGNTMTPLPWSNVVANDEFGFLVTESGSGYTWYSNSRENKITPWSNDPILDPPGEIVYIRDEDTGDTWTITPGPIRNEGEYVIRHGQGYSVFEHYKGRLNQELTLFVCPDQPVKFYHIKLKNDSQIPRRLSLTFYVEWVCGVNRIPSNQFIITEKDDRLNAVFARNPYNEEHGDRIAFIATNKSDSQVTGDRVEFIGRNGNLKNPVALDREGLSGKVGGGLDPCGAIRIVAEIPPGEEDEIVFILGQGQDIDQARDLIRKYAHGNIASDILDVAKNFWDEKLGRVQVTTPDESMNIMLNRWLLYQTFCCRIMARTGFYQAGGAYGFRDQLQDSLALIYSDPNRMREQIILSSEHQFTEGDVQHWWHPPHRGVRTRITDDLLFLPYLTANYIEGVKDWSILDVHTHYLEDDPLAEDEHDRYNMPNLSENKESIYDHCIRAIEKSLHFGERELPLMGMGDWNDGMDNVGAEGRGESVWLGWFLYTVLDNFIPICEERGDIERAQRYSKLLDELQQNIERNGWDGGWYRRAYFDDGTPLGSEKNEECRIDAISQSWAVISGAASPSRARIALDSMERHLIHKEEGLIQLLTPPFHKSSLEPGYIKGYVPGVRENGGQYTHAATWAILANAKLGHGNKAWEFFHMINPVNHGSTWFEINKYKAEPYVMAADVYTVQPHVGRGGWTWYTGSSAWMYRVGIEWILGLKLRGDEIYIDPCIPSDWEGFNMTYKHKNTSYDIRVENPEGISQGVKEVWLDNKRIDDKSILLQDEGETHQVKVILGTT